MSKTILIVEDELRMRRLITDYFKRENFDILEAEDGLKALEIFNRNKVDLVVLDIMIPLMDGWEVCRRIRENSYTPVIMLTAKSQEEDKLLGYDLGADDYMTKPFSPKILVAKVKALLKRADPSPEADIEVMDLGGIKISEASHQVWVEDEEIILSPKEYDLLLYLVHNKGLALSRSKILDNVWGFDYYGDERTVDTNIKRLREKLKSKAELISTVRGSGYRFEVKK